jgi:hypothetical protein
LIYWTEGEPGDGVTAPKLGVTCNFDPVCPFHPKKTMEIRDCKLLHFSLRMDDNWDSHALDVNFTCPICGYKDTFGVAVSEDHHTKVIGIVDEDREKEDGVWKHELKEIEKNEKGTSEIGSDDWMEAYE